VVVRNEEGLAPISLSMRTLSAVTVAACSRARTCPTGNFRMRAMRKLPVVPICRRCQRLPRRANHNDALAHPASMKRDVRAVVTIREVGMRWTLWARQTNVA